MIFSKYSNYDTIYKFVNDSFPRHESINWGSDNIRINKVGPGWELICFGIPIMYRSSDNDLFLNTQEYPIKISKIQNEIKQLSSNYQEVDESGIKSAILVDERTAFRHNQEQK